MYLFTRINTMSAARARDAIHFAGEITDYVNSHSELDVTAHSFLFGRPTGTLAWSCTVERHAQIIAAENALNGDDSYMDRPAKATELFLGPPEDAFREILHAAGDMDAPPRFTSAVLATCNADRMGDAMAWGVEMAELVNAVSGRPCAFLGDAYGAFGGVAWLTAFEDADSIDDLRGQLQADDRYLSKMSASTGLFVPGTGRTSLLQRVI